MEIKLVKNIAVIIFDMEEDKGVERYDEIYDELMNEIALDTSYKIHILISDRGHDIDNNFRDYIIFTDFVEAIIEMNSTGRPIFVHKKFDENSENLFMLKYEYLGSIKLLKEEELIIGDVLYCKRKGKYVQMKLPVINLA